MSNDLPRTSSSSSSSSYSLVWRKKNVWHKHCAINVSIIFVNRIQPFLLFFGHCNQIMKQRRNSVENESYACCRAVAPIFSLVSLNQKWVRAYTILYLSNSLKSLGCAHARTRKHCVYSLFHTQFTFFPFENNYWFCSLRRNYKCKIVKIK